MFDNLIDLRFKCPECGTNGTTDQHYPIEIQTKNGPQFLGKYIVHYPYDRCKPTKCKACKHPKSWCKSHGCWDKKCKAHTKHNSHYVPDGCECPDWHDEDDIFRTFDSNVPYTPHLSFDDIETGTISAIVSCLSPYCRARSNFKSVIDHGYVSGFSAVCDVEYPIVDSRVQGPARITEKFPFYKLDDAAAWKKFQTQLKKKPGASVAWKKALKKNDNQPALALPDLFYW